jgi:ketosteroid isomerase-like protein
MSQENVEIARASFEAWNAGDMGAFGESYDPHVVVRYADGWPEGSEPIMGREAVMRQWEQQRDAFDADTLELIEIMTWVTESSRDSSGVPKAVVLT